jgi:4-hydroxybutyrate CoA-transferase
VFFGKNERVNYNAGMEIGKCSVDYVPMFLGDIPRWIGRDGVPIDIALIMISPPDKHGWCRLGVNIDIAPPALEKAKIIIAQVNDCVPRTHGTAIHISEIDAIVPHNHPLIEEPAVGTTEVDDKIGEIIAELIPDGACLQMGIGAIPNAVLKALENHKDLGIHTEMFSDGLIPLVEKGVVTCKKKTLDKGKIVTAFVKGSKKAYDFVDDNPFVQFKSSLYVNDPFVISQQEKMMSINSAIEIDLTGQICADSIGTRFYSGVGGQVDFMYGAARSLGGKPITALPSVTAKGESKIVPTLKLGAGVVTTRAHAHWVVTEWGAVNLHGKNLRQRAMAMISIAHPDHREALYNAAIERFSHCGDYGNSNCICAATEH